METIGRAAVDVPTPARSGFDAQLGAELRRWVTAEPGAAPDGFTLSWLVTARSRVVGRSRLWDPLVEALAEIRRRHAEHLRTVDPFTAAHLDAVLAQHDGALDEESYLALPLLRLVAADERSNLDPARLCSLLLADLLRHEQFADRAARPDPDAHAERTGRIAACIAQSDPALGTAVPAPPGTAAGEWLTLSALPLSTAHDEYLLIRVLQAGELVFGAMTGLVEQAVAAARDDQPDRAAGLVRQARHGVALAVDLAGLLAGIRTEGLPAPADVDLTAPRGYRRFERATRALVGGDLPGDDLRAAVAALEAGRREWKVAHDAGIARLTPTAAPVSAPAPRPSRPPLVERAALPTPSRVGSPITLRTVSPAPAAPRPAPPAVPGIARAVPVVAAAAHAAPAPAPPAPGATEPEQPPGVPEPAVDGAPTRQPAAGPFVRRCANNRTVVSDTLRIAFGR